MALEYNGQRIGAMQYNGVTIGEAMMNGQVVYSSMSWPQGFYIGPNEQWAAVGQWSYAGQYFNFGPIPHPTYPATKITGTGISVPAGRYTIAAQATHATTTSYLKGVRVTLNGAVISGLSNQATSTRTVSSVSATVTIGAGIVSMEKYDAQWYTRTGLFYADSTFLTITPA